MPAFADFNWQRRQLVAGNRRELVRLLRYTEFIGWWGWALGIKPEQAERQPTPQEAWAHVEALARRDPPNKVALCILNCALHDRDGKRRLHRQYVPKWGGYNYLCNPDPEIEGMVSGKVLAPGHRGGPSKREPIRSVPGSPSSQSAGERVNRFTLTYEREVAEVGTFKLDGMRYDNPVVFATDNFRREHFQWADHPLAFDHVSKHPVIPLDFSSFECAQAIADDMHHRGKLVGSNFTPVAYPSDFFRIQLLDIVGSETLWTWPTNAKLALQRALASQKIVSMSWQEAKRDWPCERIEREMKQAMFYGTFYYLSSMSPELYARWNPLTGRLAAAGWEPITHARCPALGPMVERFGSLAGRSLHFTLRNEGKEPQPVELDIDARALDLAVTPRPQLWLMRDAGTYEALDVDRTGPRWLVRLTVPAQDTVVLRAATRFGLALDHLFLVPDHLLRAANYRAALRESKTSPVCPDYDNLIRQVKAAQSLLPARDVQISKVQAQLRSIPASLAQLNVPSAAALSGEAAWWLQRLTECNRTARQGISAAIEALSEK